MDTPQPEEDDVLITLDPLDVVERVLLAENLSFDRTEDGDLASSQAVERWIFSARRSIERQSCRQSASGRQANQSS